LQKAVTSKRDLQEVLDVGRLESCYECGICTASCPTAEMLSGHYNPRGLLAKICIDPETALTSEELWFCAWCYRCYKRCPQALDLPEIFLSARSTAIQKGITKPLEKALWKIVESIPLPLVTSLVCFHPERTGLSTDTVLKKVEQIQKDLLRGQKDHKARKGTEKKAVIVGSGPAGLTVAHELGLKGYDVTVYEALPETGGMLRKCIPEHRLPERVLDKEIETLKAVGIKIQTNVAIGTDVDFNDLWKKGARAIFIGVGAHGNRELEIEGRDLKGVSQALDFLWDARSGREMTAGKNVLVVGGGNVALDAARTARALGARDVTVLYRRSRNEMPANPWEIKEAESEGVKFEFMVAPTRILGEKGRVSAIECVRMQLGQLDETGRRKPIPIEGTASKREADRIILAIGERPNLGFLPKEIKLNEDGTIWVDPFTLQTSKQGVFAGGDAVTGPATVIEAIQAGKHAAESIEKLISGD